MNTGVIGNDLFIQSFIQQRVTVQLFCAMYCSTWERDVKKIKKNNFLTFCSLYHIIEDII